MIDGYCDTGTSNTPTRYLPRPHKTLGSYAIYHDKDIRLKISTINLSLRSVPFLLLSCLIITRGEKMKKKELA